MTSSPKPRVLIVCYSRTGTTRSAVSALADALDADVGDIRCDQYRRGMFRYLRAGYDSVKGNLPVIDGPSQTPVDYDAVILASPIWTSYPALPLRAYLTDRPDLPAHIGLLLTHGAHSPPEKAVQMVQDLLPKPLMASLALREADVKKGASADAIRAFADEIRSTVRP